MAKGIDDREKEAEEQRDGKRMAGDEARRLGYNHLRVSQLLDRPKRWTCYEDCDRLLESQHYRRYYSRIEAAD